MGCNKLHQDPETTQLDLFDSGFTLCHMDVSQAVIDSKFQTASFDELLGDLVTEIETQNYSVTRINHIDNIYDRREAGMDVTIGFKRYKIVEFCNLNSCSELISADLLAGVFMPVRFVVYQRIDESATHIAYLKPTAFAAMFNSEPLMHVAIQIEEDMVRVLEELDY